MSIFVHTTNLTWSHRSATRAGLMPSILAIAKAVLGWPLRVHANRKLLNQMVGMSAYELADIGLTASDIQDTASLPLDTEVGQFLATRVAARRRAWNDRWT